METAFGWIGKFMEWVGDFFPRWQVVPITHGGVAFVRGKNVKVIKPGLFWYWPIWTDFIIYPVVRQTLDLDDQTLTTTDGIPITIAAVIVYEITDIEKALTVQYDLEDTISDISLVAVRKYTVPRTFEEIRNGDERELKEECQRKLARYGVAVRDASLVNFAQTRVISLIGGGTVVGDFEEE